MRIKQHSVTFSEATKLTVIITVHVKSIFNSITQIISKQSFLFTVAATRFGF